MKKLLAFLLVVGLVLGMAFALVSCNKYVPIEKRDYITVGLECGYAPFNWTQVDDSNGAVKISNTDGYANGYDVLIAKEIARAFGKTLKIVKYDWDALIPAVSSGALDFIIAGMSPTDKRKESIAFSDAYYNSQLVIVVKKNGAYANATSLNDLSGAKIAAQQGTFHDDALRAQSSDYGIAYQTAMEDFPAMIGALDLGVIDGYVAEEPGALADCAGHPDFTYISLVNNAPNGGGFIATSNDTAVAIGLKKGTDYAAIINRTLALIDKEAFMELAKAWSVDFY